MRLKLCLSHCGDARQRASEVLFIVAERAGADGFIYILIMVKESVQR